MSWFAIMLVSSSVFLAIVSANKHDILVNTARESWISAGNFTTLLEVSFNVSKCCNVQISGQSAGTENFFNEFVKIYPYEYLVNNKTYNCNGYFMISETVINLVTDIEKAPTRISTTEFLIILDDNVGNSTRLFNTSIYENSKVNIVTIDGLWTLSENFLKPRVFKKWSRYSEMVHKQGPANFEGRELQGAAKPSPPFSYLQKTVNRTVNGIRTEIFEAKNDSELDGVEMKLFMLIAERLNFTWTIRQPNPHEGYGTSNGTHWNGGLIGLLFRKEVDIAFGSLWLTEESYRFSNLTIPWSTMDMRFLVPRPKSHPSVWALTEPLSPQVWLAILAVLILQTVHAYTSSWISPRIANRFQSLTVTWTELIGRLLGTWAPRNMRGLEIQFQLWHFMSILVVTAYSSSLAAILTNPKYDSRIDCPQDFVKANLTWGRTDTVIDFSLLFNQHDRYAEQMSKLFNLEQSETQRHERILMGSYAVIGKTISSTFFPVDRVQVEDLENLRVMREPMCTYYITFAVQPWLLQPIDKVLSRLKEGGLVDYHMHDVLHRRTGSALREVMIEHDGHINTPRVLQLTPLAAGFSMLIVGLVISSIVFCIELHTASRKKSIRDVLLEINRKREAWRLMNYKKKSGSPVIKLQFRD